MPKYLFTITGSGPSNKSGEKQELVGSGSVEAPNRERAEAAIREDHRRRGHTIDRLRIYGGN